MTATVVDTPSGQVSESDLLAQARAGDDAAFADLFRLHHRAALALARSLTDPTRAQDLVSEAFARIYRLVRKGGGPQTNFRAYLYTTIRAVNVDSLRKTGRELAVDDVGSVRELATPDDAEAMAENDAVFRAFRSLPERWQKVLWETAVEGRAPQEIGQRLGMTPNSVAALSFRAREGLRQAYLTQHIDQIPSGCECEKHANDLAKYVRGALTPGQRADLEEHVRRCRECSAVVAGLKCMNNRLGAVLLPVFLLSLPVSGEVAGGLVGGTSATAGAAALKGKLLGLCRAARESLAAANPAAAVAFASVVVAASAVAVVAQTRGSDSPVAGERVHTRPAAVGSGQTPERAAQRPGSTAKGVTQRPVTPPQARRVEPGSSSEPLATAGKPTPATPEPSAVAESTPSPKTPEPTQLPTEPTEPATTPAPTTAPTPTPTEPTPCLLHVETVGCLVTTPELTTPVPPTP